MWEPVGTLWADFKSQDVRRQVMAGLILVAVLAAVGAAVGFIAYLWSHRAEAVNPLYAWLSEAVRLQRWGLAVCLLAALLCGMGLAAARNGIQAAPVALPPAAPPEAARPEPLSIPTNFEPTRPQIILLIELLRTHPEEAELRTATVWLRTLNDWVTAGHAEVELERLTAAGLVSTRRVTDNHAYYRLTIPGRDWVLAWTEIAH